MQSPEQLALALFDDFVDLSPKARGKALEKLRQENPRVHELLVVLLAADEESHVLDELPLDSLARATLEPDADDVAQQMQEHQARVGTRVGAWDLHEILGVGGMGAVYLAQRADGHYDQVAAVKCLRRDLASPALVSAFRNERNLLARLNHSFIVPMLDGGVDEHGSPWFAMQQVEGLPITEWCDQQKLSISQRIELFIQACDAISYAHSQMIVHQDIKPSNLMVNVRGRPKLLDFGLSALLSESSDENRRIAFSSGYSAPEILDGSPPSAAMDIYSLGVVLYQLLCADWPRRMRASDMLVPMARQERALSPSERALKASVEVARARQRRSPEALSKALAGDLDAICLKCVATNPEERYASVRDLQFDLRAYLAFQPISIRGGTRYRLGRALRRNAQLLTLSGAVLVSAIAGLGLTLWQSQRAEREAHSAQVINRLFEETLGSAALAGVGANQVNSRSLLDETEQRLRALPADEADSAVILQRGLVALAKGYAAIGEYAHATVLASEARELGNDDPLQYARNAGTLATLLNLQGNYAQAETMARSALKELQDNASMQSQAEQVALQSSIASARWGQGDKQTAFDIINQALGQARHVGPDAQAQLLILRGSWNAALLQLHTAEKDLQQAVALSQGQYPETYYSACEELANLYRTMLRVDDADRIARILVEQRSSFLGMNHPETGRAWLELAHIQQVQGDWQDATQSLDNAERILRASLGSHSPELVGVLMARSTESVVLYNDRELAVSQARQAAFLARKAHGPAHLTTIRAESNLAVKLTFNSRGGDADRSKHLLEAEKLFKDIFQRAQANNVPTPSDRLIYAVALLNSGRVDESEQQIDLAEPMIRNYYGNGHSLWQYLRLVRVNVMVARRQYAMAYTALGTIIADIEKLPANRYNRQMLVEAYELHGTLAAHRGAHEQARESWRKAISHADAESARVARLQGYINGGQATLQMEEAIDEQP
ncbi:serine/threonine-protein kinase [Pseudoxanthomonas dokdonensis]|uniref:Protein kinase domain-containing protein n=1 Tax=Pseudoxanthomonas dokdonensis TaxID=344882 RepID=A0A0R0CR25_9GAMM|nr:serine/threonine-protein kinase [Pseudoxanthomonas dokdonensis]KRG71973.1 hypothetical protein ABB29_00445 [Pseudoxanthomonas dokdonensis]